MEYENRWRWTEEQHRKTNRLGDCSISSTAQDQSRNGKYTESQIEYGKWDYNDQRNEKKFWLELIVAAARLLWNLIICRKMTVHIAKGGYFWIHAVQPIAMPSGRRRTLRKQSGQTKWMSDDGTNVMVNELISESHRRELQTAYSPPCYDFVLLTR